ncbi:hypothetical protein SLS58_005506 [Diplodia intermedia]|uniref:Uncharacterized protein n=1 Tax=Diplodia intermedia TaxID=856260 RepID=A0ABR3TR28_9PEZI
MEPQHTARPGPAPRLFPATLNGYHDWKSMSPLHLGTSATQTTHAATIHDENRYSRSSRQQMRLVLYAGPMTEDEVEAEHPMLASVDSSGGCWGSGDFTVTVPAAARDYGGGCAAPDAVVNVHGGKTGTGRTAARFEVEVDVDDVDVVGAGGRDAERSAGASGGSRRRGRRVEAFEWRGSSGEHVRRVATGPSAGWKLVRLAGGEEEEEEEVVAVIAHNASWSKTKKLRFAFVGSGLTGGLGELWEIVVVVSALKMWVTGSRKRAAMPAATA